jgi:hypothetical protein
MTKDRQNILVSCWEAQFRTCACGRCGCAAPDPVAWARTILGCWSRQSLEIAERDEESAKRIDEIADTGERNFLKLARNAVRRRAKAGLPPPEDDGKPPGDPFGDIAKMRAENVSRRAKARRYRHAAELYGRLSRGEPPFQPSARAA